MQSDLESKFIHYYKQNKNAKRRHERVMTHSIKQNKRNDMTTNDRKKKDEKEKVIYAILETKRDPGPDFLNCKTDEEKRKR